MMGPESQGEPDLPTSKDASMETLALDDEEDLTSKSYSNGRSADKMVSDSREPLSPSIVGVSADSHPLSSPPHPIQSLGASDSRQDSHLGSPSCAVSPPEDNASFVGEVNGSHSAVIDFDNSVTISRFRSSDSTYLKVVVSDPEKVVESSSSIVPGGNTFYTYLITAETNLADYGGSIFTVRRRFNDVVILADRLSEAYRGFFIPPRPDKSVVESQMMQKQDFAEQRRVALERYLQRLAVHPVIKKSDELRVFLQVQGRLPLPSTTDVASRMLDGAVKLPKQIFGDYGKNSIEPQDVVQPARNGRDLLRLFKEMKQSVVNDWGKSKPLIEEDDKEFLEKKERLHDLEQHLSNSSKQAESIVKAQQDMGETLGHLGLAFVKLMKFENEWGNSDTQRERAAGMKIVATAAVKTSRLYHGLNVHTVKYLDILHEHLGLMLAVRNAFSDRSSALLTVQTLLSEMSSLNSRVEKLETTSSKIFEADKSRNRKLEELKDAIKTTEVAKTCAVKEYERIKEHNRSEIERLDRERHDDLIIMLKGFVISQVDYSEKIEIEWAKLEEETRQYARDAA
nr:sorting nexin 2B-like isoform X2 [Ipomoea batatas]